MKHFYFYIVIIEIGYTKELRKDKEKIVVFTHSSSKYVEVNSAMLNDLRVDHCIRDIYI